MDPPMTAAEKKDIERLASELDDDKEPETNSWVRGVLERTGNTLAAHPAKSTVALSIAASQLEKRVIEPLASKIWGAGKSLLAKGAAEAVEEAVAEEATEGAVAALAGSLNPLSLLTKAFNVR